MLERFHVPHDTEVRVTEAALRATVEGIFTALGIPEEDARQGADVLIYADLRGVETHGVSNMLRVYVQQYQEGKLDPTGQFTIMRERPSTAAIDGGNTLGIFQGPKAMRLAIDKARDTGAGIVTVRNVGHTGAVGYHAMLAADEDMIGVSLTAGGALVVPTFGAEPRLGTNPIAMAAPTRDRPRFLFDAATSAVAGNKLILASRLGVTLHPGWITSWNGAPIMEEAYLPERGQFSQLPLGSTREMGSHKGYGLAVMNEILCSVLGSALPSMLDVESGSKQFLAAYDIGAFCDVDRFKEAMDDMLGALLDTPPAPGHDRVIYPGVSEEEELEERTARGIPLHPEVIEWFSATCRDLGIPELESL
ncbi:MAG: Ldh family oxidoreductase [Thermomicrobiales bacterium]